MIKKGVRYITNFFINNGDYFLNVLTAGVIVALYLFDIIDITILVSTIGGLSIFIVMNIVRRLNEKKQLLIVSLTTSYIISEDNNKIDYLLSRLISNNGTSNIGDPVQIFFNCIGEICESDNVEMRRRVAEALPALYMLDRKKSMTIVDILRCDYDNNKWKSDNRRRTIESFPYIFMYEKEYVKDTLKIHYNDEIYTLIAIVEVIHQFKYKESLDLFADLLLDLPKYNFTEADRELLQREWDLLDIIKNSPLTAIRKFDEILSSKNEILMKICVARNILRVCSFYPQCTKCKKCKGDPNIVLKYINHFLKMSNSRNLKRPMAKENILDCQMLILKRRDYAELVKRNIWSLLKNEDEIIRRPAFDKILGIIDADPQFGHSIIDYFREQSEDLVLKTRAENININKNKE